MVVLVAGKSGSGKSSFSQHLKRWLETEWGVKSRIVSFAEELKEIAMVDFDWDGEKDEKGRRLLQALGSAGREYNANIWVNKVKEVILNPRGYYTHATEVMVSIIDDCRYENEFTFADEMKDTYAIKVLIVRPDNPNALSGKAGTHASEHGLDNLPLDKYDYVINNSGDMKRLDKYAKLIAEDVFCGVFASGWAN